MIWILIPLYACLTYNYLGYFKEDFTLFERAIKVSPFCKEAHAHLGYAYLKKGNYAMAIYHYHQATQPEANFYTYSPLPEVYNNLGVIFLRLRQYEEAKKWLKKGLKLDPTNKVLLTNLNILKGLLEK
jgi:tetratricopeptide (TPR) repeat protein